jgi:hypothetical protein
VKGIKFVGKHCSWTATSVGVRWNKRIRIFLYSVSMRTGYARFYICVYLYWTTSQIYKSIFKLSINSNSPTVQEDREKANFVWITTCMETPRCSLDAALPVVENLQKYRYILENIDFTDFSWFVPNFALHINNIDWEVFWLVTDLFRRLV